MISYTLIIILISLITLESLAQWFLKKSITVIPANVNPVNINPVNLNNYAIFGIILYSIVGYIYRLLLLNGVKLSIANIIWNAGTTITILLIGNLYFGEKLTPYQLFGCILIIIGSLFINI